MEITEEMVLEAVKKANEDQKWLMEQTYKNELKYPKGHTTHHACKETIEHYGVQTIGCC